ncbi:MAG: hypothetical protein M1838_002138 [Thelocarpon superellum]|nr:MAG: hypothetical protein M1838_002138 [Thelocarpon superellum]
MVCGSKQSSTTGWTLGAISLLHWVFIGPITNHVEPAVDADVAPAQDIQQCKVSLTQDWNWTCQTEIVIATDGEPQDLFAIAGLFKQANDASKTLRCEDKDYPIKAVLTGGGYNTQTSWLLLRNFLLQLQQAGIVPDSSKFNVYTQMEAGPVARDYRQPRYWGPPMAFDAAGSDVPWARGAQLAQSQLESMSHTYQLEMLRLMKLRAPIIVALRPLFEFAVAWTESKREMRSATFTPTEGYEVFEQQQRIRSAPLPPADATTAATPRAIMEAFRRSKVIMYQGKTKFGQMGQFFAGDIMNSTATPDAHDQVVELEQDFVTWPQEFILVDRESLISNNAPFIERPLFTREAQRPVFEQLGTIPELSHKLLDYIWRWNRPITRHEEAQVMDLLAKYPETSNPTNGKSFLSKFITLNETVTRLAAAEMRGDGIEAIVKAWKSSVVDLATTMVAHGHPLRNGRLTNGAKWDPLSVLRPWANVALTERSRVKATDVLLPFCLDPTPNNLVRQSLQRVKYAGNASGAYLWTAAPYSDSTVWFTNATVSASASVSANGGASGAGSGVVDNADVSNRQDQLQQQLQRFYTAAFTRT